MAAPCASSVPPCRECCSAVSFVACKKTRRRGAEVLVVLRSRAVLCGLWQPGSGLLESCSHLPAVCALVTL